MKRLIWLLFFISGPLYAGSVTLAWDASISTGVVGYKVYHGSTSGNYTAPEIIGNKLTHTVRDLPAGEYFFAVTAYDASGNESMFSNEVSATVEDGVCQKADMNCDGQINIVDIQILTNCVLHTGNCPE